MGLTTAKDYNHRMQERFLEVSQRKLGVSACMSRSPAYSFCGYLRSSSICCGHEIL